MISYQPHNLNIYHHFLLDKGEDGIDYLNAYTGWHKFTLIPKPVHACLSDNLWQLIYLSQSVELGYV